MDNVIFTYESLDFYPGAKYASLVQDGMCHQQGYNVPTQAGCAEVIDPAWKVIASQNSSSRLDMLVQTKDAIGYFTKYHDTDMIYYRFASDNPDVLSDYVETVKKNAPPVDVKNDGTVNVSFWSCGSTGPNSINRKIAVESWAGVSRNYSAGTTKQMEKLFSMVPPFDGGRLVLWHGPPGVGKSHAIRALIKHWQPWCDVNYIVDPDVLFRSAASLMSVLLDNDGYGKVDVAQFPEDTFILQGSERWRMFIMEDCDEFLQSDAKARQGQALSRLLNIADGFIGQGLRVIFLITTNEKLSNIHAAVSRTGRCVANTEFGLFSREEAQTWLGSIDNDLPNEITLSDLYDRKRKTKQISLDKDDKNTKIGQYL